MELVADALTLHKTTAELAKELNLNEKTVLNYLGALYDKTGTSNKFAEPCDIHGVLILRLSLRHLRNGYARYSFRRNTCRTKFCGNRY